MISKKLISLSEQERWIAECKMLIEEIKKLENMEGQDRLDMVRTIRFVLFALQRSVSGWAEWVNNPDIMAGFSIEGLKQISCNLAKLTESFIEYDSQITMDFQKSLPRIQPEEQNRQTKKQDEKKLFYIK